MATGIRGRAGTGPNPKLATTRKAPAIVAAPSRLALVLRYAAGLALIGAAFLVVPRLGGPEWLRWVLGIGGFVVGNLVRPLYRDPVRKRDETFATALEIIHFLLVAIALAAIGLVLLRFSRDAVVAALLRFEVLACATAFFGLVGLRDLMYRWRSI